MHTAGILRELGLKSLFYIYAFGVVPLGWYTQDTPISGARVSMSVFVGPAWMLLF